MKENIIIFDFDGVLIDSALELCISSYNIASDSLVTTSDDLPKGFEEYFRRSKGNTRNGGEMVLLAQEVLRRLSVRNHEVIPRDEILKLVEGQDLLALREGFLTKRKALVEASLEDWVHLHKPIEKIWSYFASLPIEQRFILTYKDLWSVMTLCNHFGVELQPEQVYSSDTKKKKHENFVDLTKKFHFQQYHFVDDSPFNLLEISEKYHTQEEISLLFADWGYGSSHHLDTDDSHDIISVDQKRFIDYMSSVSM